MKILNKLERITWCEERSVRINNSGIVGSARSVALRVPEKTDRLLDILCELLSNEQEFPGGLSWIVDLGSHSNEVCQIGLSIHSLMCGISDDPAAVDQRPKDLSFLFNQRERSVAQAFLLHSFLFGWGGYFVPGHGKYYLFINPDGVFEAFSEADEWIGFFSRFPERLGVRQNGRWIDRKPRSF